MSQWKKPTLQHVMFRMEYPLNFSVPRMVGEFQTKLDLRGELALAEDGLPEYRLARRDDPNSLVRVTMKNISYLTSNYTDWAEFKTRLLVLMDEFPLPLRNREHLFIGLLYIDSIELYPRTVPVVPIDQYLQVSMKGPGRFGESPFRSAAWVTDYVLGPDNYQLQLRVETKPADHEGIEHLLVTTDTRIVGPDSTPMEEFLDRAHKDANDAYYSLLQPNLLRALKEGEAS